MSGSATAEASPEVRHRRRLTLLLLLGVILRTRLLDRVFDYDETFSWLLARQPLGTLLAANHGDVHPPLYYLLLSWWGALFGYSELSLRLPSLMAGLGLIALIYRLGRRLGVGDRQTCLAALIAAVSPFQVFFSQEARMYELEALAFLAAACGLVERRRWLLVGGSLGALYLHNSAALFVALLFVAGWVWRPDRRAHVVDGALVVAGFLPGVPRLLHQAGGLAGGYWITRASWLGLPDVLHSFTALIFDWTTGLVGFVLVTAGVVWLLVLIDRALRETSPRWRLLAWLALGPLLALALVSLMWQPVLLYRTVGPSAPFLYLLLADDGLRDGKRRALAAVTVGLALAITLHGQYFQPVKMFERLHVAEMRPGDGVYHFHPGSFISYLYSGAEQDLRHVASPLEAGLRYGSLSAETASVLGLEHRDLEDVLCDVPAWFLLWIDGDEVDRGLRGQFAEIKRRYHPRLIRIQMELEPTPATHALYRLETAPFCGNRGLSPPP